MTDRWNLAALNDGGTLPNPRHASAGELGRVLEGLAALAPELTADLVTEELRLAQYDRTAQFAHWIAEAAESLAGGLRAELNRRNGGQA